MIDTRRMEHDILSFDLILFNDRIEDSICGLLGRKKVWKDMDFDKPYFDKPYFDKP
jgi:hypothetical protein